MKRIYAYLLAAGLMSLAATGVIVLNIGGSTEPSLQEALGGGDNGLSPVFAKRLYPSSNALDQTPAPAPVSPSTYLPKPGPSPDRTVSPPAGSVQIGSNIWVTNQDRSTVDIELKPGTRDQIVSSRSYYPIQPGETGRRPHVIQLYATLPGVALDETVLRLDGSLAEHTQEMDDKSKHIVDFGPDGTTLVGEQQIVPTEYSGPRLLIEQRWRLDSDHTLKFRNQFNPDQTRTITDFDEHLRPLRIIQLPQNDIAAGSIVVAYYPGSLKKRMEAKGNYYSNDADYYREDGTLDYHLRLSPGMTHIEYFDATGKVKLLEQDFFRHVKVENGVEKFSYELYTVTIFDTHGEQVRNIDYNGETGKMREDEHSNVTIDGTKWFRVDYSFDENEDLHLVTYWLTEVKFPPQKKEEHKPEEHIHPDPIAADMMTIRVPLEEDLPIPPSQSMWGH